MVVKVIIIKKPNNDAKHTITMEKSTNFSPNVPNAFFAKLEYSNTSTSIPAAVKTTSPYHVDTAANAYPINAPIIPLVAKTFGWFKIPAALHSELKQW